MTALHLLSTRPASPARRLRPTRGFTLVEAAVSLGITSALLAGAATPLRQTLSTHRLEAAAALLETDLKYARALALAADAPVRLEIQARTDGSTCYIVYSGPAGACQCTGVHASTGAPQGTSGSTAAAPVAGTASGAPAQCTAGAELHRVADQPAGSGVRMVHSGKALVFDPGKGTVTPTATIAVTDADGRAIHQVVNLMGRTRSCSPQKLAGLKACS